MPGQICKEIIDHGNALIQSVGCMQASVTLGHVEGAYAKYELVEKFEQAAEACALAAQNVANDIHLSSTITRSNGELPKGERPIRPK